MSKTFTKLFSSITESTVWFEDDHTRLTWITMMAMADQRGRVWGSVPGLAARARVPVESCRAALAKFLAPDPDSRTKTYDGRRIEEIDGGWRLLNHGKYRDVRDEEAERARKRAWAKKRRDEAKASAQADDGQGRVDAKVDEVDALRRRSTSTSTSMSTRVDARRHNAEAEAEAEADPDLSSLRSESSQNNLVEFGHPNSTSEPAESSDQPETAGGPDAPPPAESGPSEPQTAEAATSGPAADEEPVKPKPAPSADVTRVFETWRSLHATPRSKLDPKRAARIKARLADGFTADELEQALRGALADDWLMGRDPKSGGRSYRAVETLLRDAGQVERLMALHASPPRAVVASIGSGRAGQRVDPETGYVHLTDRQGRPVQGYDPKAPWLQGILTPLPAAPDNDEADEVARVAG